MVEKIVRKLSLWLLVMSDCGKRWSLSLDITYPWITLKRNKHVKKIILVERNGQFKSDIQSLEDFVHFKISESQWLPTIQLIAWFWTISSKAQSLAVWGFHTTQTYSMYDIVQAKISPLKAQKSQGKNPKHTSWIVYI